ncbi:MAG: hypothetical protein ACLFPF_10385 [Halanaerobiales bacterium]
MANFWDSLAQSYIESGGINQLATGIARNVAGGKHYDPYSDPQFLQKMQNARALGTPSARQAVADEYGQYMDTGDMSAVDYIFNPAEGTPEWRQNRLDEINYNNALMQSEYLPEQIEMEKALNQTNLQKAQTYNDYYDSLLQNQVESGDIAIDTSLFNLNRGRTMMPFEVEQAQQGLDMGDLQLESNRFQLDHMQDMAPYEKAQAENNLAMQEGQLYQLQTQNKYFEDMLQQDMSAQELQNAGAELQMEINRMQRDLNRELYPIEIEIAKNNVLQQQLQNKGMQLSNTGQELSNIYQGTRNQMAEYELDQLMNPSEPIDDNDVSWSALMQSLGLDMGDYAGTTPGGAPVFESVRGGRIALDPRNASGYTDWTGKEVIGEGYEMTGDRIVYSLDDGTQLYTNDNGVAVYADGTPYRDSQGNLYYLSRDPLLDEIELLPYQAQLEPDVPEEETEESGPPWYDFLIPKGDENLNNETEDGILQIDDKHEYSEIINKYLRENNVTAPENEQTNEPYISQIPMGSPSGEGEPMPENNDVIEDTPDYTVDQVINLFMQRNPGIPSQELANMLDERYTNLDFVKNTGLSKYQVIGRLRSMR